MKGSSKHIPDDEKISATEQEIMMLLQELQAPHFHADDLDPRSDDDAVQMNILPLLHGYTPKPPQPETRVQSHKPTDDNAGLPQQELPSEKTTVKRTARFWQAIFPWRGDSAGEVIRKCVALLSACVFLLSAGFLLYYMVIEPQQVQRTADKYIHMYRDTENNELTGSLQNYPAGMLTSFRQLYDINKDVAGWLTYTSNDTAKFLDIDLPVVHCDDNSTYLHTAFDGSKSRSGTLFFDKSNIITPDARNRVSIVYGHNMASGKMFARLNKLISNIHYARSAPLIKLSTLYERQQYKVFAVILCDEDADPERYFTYLRTAFSDDSDFLNYVQELRARSLYDYPVDVDASDELLILSTCTTKSQSKLENGRLAVIARRVRADEETHTNTAHILQNEDVIMPYAWYTAQKLAPHIFYTQSDYHLPQDSNTTTAAPSSASADSTTDGTTASTAAMIATTRVPAASTTTVSPRTAAGTTTAATTTTTGTTIAAATTLPTTTNGMTTTTAAATTHTNSEGTTHE